MYFNVTLRVDQRALYSASVVHELTLFRLDHDLHVQPEVGAVLAVLHGIGHDLVAAGAFLQAIMIDGNRPTNL